MDAFSSLPPAAPDPWITLVPPAPEDPRPSWSPWATSFRRDYRFVDRFYYNVDGSLDVLLPDPSDHPHPSREELSVPERVELLVHRCFIKVDKHDADLWPWDDTFNAPPQSTTLA